MPVLADVAARAGVSKATASRVLAGLAADYRITSTTAERVVAAAKILGWRPQRTAQVRTGLRPGCIGLLQASSDFIGPARFLHASVLGGVLSGVRKAGMQVLLTGETASQGDLGLDLGTARRIDALVAMAYVFTPGFTPLDLEALDLPVVVVGNPPVPTRHPVIIPDPRPGLQAAVDWLVSSGHTHLGWVGLHDGDGDMDGDGRGATVIRRGAHHGLDVVSAHLVLAGYVYDSDVATLLERHAGVLRSILRRVRPATALVCYNDLLAAALRVLAPRLMIIGIDGVIPQTGVSTVIMPWQEVGLRAAQLAVELVGDPSRRPHWQGKRIAISGKFSPLSGVAAVRGRASTTRPR